MKKSNGWHWDPPLNHIIECIRILPSGPLVIIGISGYGGAGKTTLAHELGQRLPAPVVSIDEFGTNAVFQRSDDWHGFDRPRLVRQVLAPLQNGTLAVQYDCCDDWNSWETIPTNLVVERFVVLEGVGLFHPDVLPYLDYRIWLDVPLADATTRGIARERLLGRDPGEVWKSLWEPNERDFERKYQPKESAHSLIRSVP